MSRHRGYPKKSLTAILRSFSPEVFDRRGNNVTRARDERWSQLDEQIRRAYHVGRGTYGSPRVHRELQEQGVPCCKSTVAKRMKACGLRAKTRRRFVVRTTDSRHPHPVAKNSLDREFQQPLPNQAWAADITYIPTDEGWLYLAAVIDLCSRKIVGWATADHLRADLTCQALLMAVLHRAPPRGLLHHSDRGVHLLEILVGK